jgi:GT2 family glycosyltransferase
VTPRPPLSVVIPSHRRADLLRACLASVTRFAPPGTQIVVVDDGSPGEIVSRTADGLPGVEVVRRPRPGGFCAAANAGIAAATGAVVELLNDDTEVTAGWADAAVRWFADPRVGAVAPLVLQDDPARRSRGLPPLVDSAGDEYDFGGFARKRGHGEQWAVGRGQWAVKRPFSLSTVAGPVWGVSATAGFYRRDVLLRAGGFPESFGAYFEDVDLSFRLRRLGYAAWYDPTSVVWHRVSASYGRRPGRRVLEQQSRNEELVFWRNVRGRDRWRYLPRHLAVVGGKAVRRLGEGTFFPWAVGRAKGVWSAMIGV